MPEQTAEFTDRDRRRIVRKRRSIDEAVKSLVERTDRRERLQRRDVPESSPTLQPTRAPEPSERETASAYADDASQTREIFERKRLDRRRQIDPTTCERDYSSPEIEFMRAMDDYKRRSGRPFPTWSEVLEVVTSLGYRKVAEPTTMAWRTHGDSQRE